MNASSDPAAHPPLLPPIGAGSYRWDAALGARIGRQRPAPSRREAAATQTRSAPIEPGLDAALTATFL